MRAIPADWRGPLALLLGLTVWHLLVAATLPPILDEAYYFHWARVPAAGYFDHPPGVAWLGLGTWLAPGSALAARLGALLAGVLTGLALWRLYRSAGLTGADLMLALVIASGTIPGLVVGVLTTPDAVLALAWALALHEALAALQRDRRRWLTAGLATGLGLLGKYTMLLIGPVFLWAILVSDRRALASPWPYLGGLLALLVFLPNLLWNADQDWLSLRFQFGHGFGTGALAVDASGLPPTTGPDPWEPEAPPPLVGLQRLASLGGYVVGQAALWGLLLVPLVLAAWRWTSRPLVAAPAPLTPAARALLGAALWFPLGLFAVLALTSDVEPNWPAMWLAAAAPFAALALRGLGRWVVAAAALNLLLISLYALHAATALLPLPDAFERIMRETQGYAALADHAAGLDAPVIADRYQVAAMLNFYRPELSVPQWPGVTRPSEYSRGTLAPFPSLERLQRDGFWLVARRLAVPEIPGFHLADTHTAFACKGQPVTIIERHVEFHDGPCDRPLRVWRLYRYRAD